MRSSPAVLLLTSVAATATAYSGPSYSDLDSRMQDQKRASAAIPDGIAAVSDLSTSNSTQQEVWQQQKIWSLSTVLAGSASKLLTSNICKELQMSAEGSDFQKFADGELTYTIESSVRGKNVFIVQSLAASEGMSVNDNFMALILAITANRRAGAGSVIAVIPYFSYKHNRRRQAIVTPYLSRLLWSNSADLAKMLQVAGVDKVIAVDVQRPGQGHEACFFDTQIPVETISTTNLFVDYLSSQVIQDRRLVIISSNTENLKKANKFQKKLNKKFPTLQVESGVFISNIEKHSVNDIDSEILADVNQADVIIVEEIVDLLDNESSNNIENICRKLKESGAMRITLCAPHAVLAPDSKQLIDQWPIEEIVVTDTIEIPAIRSTKVRQLPIAPLIAKIIRSEASFREGSLDNRANINKEEVVDEGFEVE
jgi:ribose-phosphate pyrophosphokinase